MVDQYDADIAKLNSQLDRQLQETVNQQTVIDTKRLLMEICDKIATLTAECQCLVTSIKVLESDVKTLRAGQAETRARQRWVSADDSLLVEMSVSEAYINPPSVPSAVERTIESVGSSSRTANSHSPPLPHALTVSITPSPNPQDCSFKNVLLIGDSHLNFKPTVCE